MHPFWPETVVPPALAADEVHVWSVPLERSLLSETDSRAVLAADERERAERFRVDDARRRFVAARGALRSILGRYLQVSPADIAFEYDAHAKPRLKHSAPAGLQFNLAHSGELALVAVTINCEVGVDVERLRDVPHWREIAERFFHRAELDQITALPVDRQINAFMRCWTAKEAVLKALGTGVSQPLDFFVGALNEQSAAWFDLPTRDARHGARCWLELLSPADGYVGAVACLEAQRRACFFAFG